MLLIGTTQGLFDLDSGEGLVDDMPVTALAPGGTAGSRALLDRRFVSVVKGKRHVTAPAGELPEADGQSLTVLADGTTVVGRTGARLTAVDPDRGNRDIRAFEEVPGRDEWENPANPTPDTRTMDAGPRRWWVNVHVGGVWWSENAGETWHGAVEPEADVHEVRAGPDGRVAAAAAIGFGWSEDGGDSWSWTTRGFDGHYLRAVALDGDTAFASASDGPFTRRGNVYRGRLGTAFSQCEGGLPDFPGNVDSGHLDAAAGRVAVGFADSVYLSEDGGQTWGPAATVPGRVTAIRFAPA